MTVYRLSALLILCLWIGCSSESSVVETDNTTECPLEGPGDNTHPPIFPTVDEKPAWSPDGRHIAYIHFDRTRTDAPSEAYQLWYVDVETLKKTFIRSGVWEVSWFPSADSLVATMVDGNLYVLGLDGTIAQQLTFDGRNNWFASVSSSGRYLVWDKDYRDIWIMDFKTGKQTRVDKQGDLNAWRAGSWSPDESLIAHIRYGNYGQTGYETIYLMDRTGTAVQRLTYKADRHLDPQWSPSSGRYIAYATKGCRWLMDIFLYGRKEDVHRRLTFEGGIEPSWSPTEDQVVYVKHNPFKPTDTDSPQNGYLHIVDVETKEELQITFASDYERNRTNHWNER